MHHEMRRLFLGPMPVDQFLDAFLPIDGDDSTSHVGIEFRLDTKWNREKFMYRPLIAAIEKLGNSDLRFCVTANSDDPDWVIEDSAPDISGYHRSNPERQLRERQFKPDDGKVSQRADFAIMDLALQVRLKLAYDPFKDPENGGDLTKHSFVKNDGQAQEILGQMCACAAAQMGMAFRTHCFSVFIASDTARLIRWDRAGAVVTRSFNYVQDSGLARFLKRFAALSPAQRGWDQTVIPLPLDSPEAIRTRDTLIQQRLNNETDEEFQKRRAYLNKAKYYKYLVPVLPTSHAGESVAHLQENRSAQPAPLLLETEAAESVPTLQADRTMDRVSFIGPFPRRWASSVLGRSSRGTPVLNPENGMIHWLKDTWRLDMETVKAEHESYAKMVKKDVRNLIPVVAAGDVREISPSRAVGTNIGAFKERSSSPSLESTPENTDKIPVRGLVHNSVHCTITDKLIDENWVCGDKKFLRQHMIGYCHYRLVLELVGRDLTSFPSVTALLQAIADALLCHGEALYKAGVLHRDISPSNILIMEDGSGKLIDWDLSRHADQGQTNRPGRTGTWQFMSGALLKNPDTRIHEAVDDLESFLHTAAFTLVRYVVSSLNSEDRTFFLTGFDEQFHFPGRTSKGGREKTLLLTAEVYAEGLEFPGLPGLGQLLRDFAFLFYPVYKPSVVGARAKTNELRTLEGGQLRIRQMILDLLSWKENHWTRDPRSKKVEIPVVPESGTVTGKRSRSRNDREPTQPVSYMSTGPSLEPLLEGNHPEQDGEDEEEGRETKRFCSDTQVV